jgi:hypothetical protein
MPLSKAGVAPEAAAHVSSGRFSDMDNTTNDPIAPETTPVTEPGVAASATTAPDTSAPVEAPPVSAAVIKFRSCRWRRPPEDGVECCGHRDVLPIAGTHSFDAEAWCPDCTYFKLRRTPKKREEPYRY